ncbi:bZIP transcription factor [Senna tora]|uniref:BZIP transcription factor n=1 Tax=Senna tora TaxID=362788 RepID=A0A834TJ52_9FABA|nr:bZIP transcription factor [Senna tora]
MESQERRSSSPSGDSSDGDAEGLVMSEIEVAETLADLAQMATRQSGDKWRKKGKRGRRTANSASNTIDSVSNTPDLSRGQAVVGHEPHQEISMSEPKEAHPDICSEEVKMEQEADFPKTSIARSYSKSKRNLTEEEKEERRIRRVMANRESARQTIRRRQALCEDLSRKAANLAQENENLKRIAKSQSARVEKTPVDHDSCAVSAANITSSASSNGPWLLYNPFPVAQLCWPSVIQSSNHVLFQPIQSPISLPSNVSVPFSSGTGLGHKQTNLIHDNHTQNPLYMFPCPWFFPLPEFGHGQPPPSIGLKDKQHDFPVDKQCSNSLSLTTVANVDNHAARPSLASMGHITALNREHGLLSLPAPNTEISSTASHIANSLLEKKQERSPGKSLADVVAAAEARKRRKELTKLKGINSRQCRMQC